MVVEALKPLGGKYTTDINNGLNPGGGWVDAQGPEDLKRKPIWLGCGDMDNDTYDDKLNTTGGARKTFQEMKDAKR